MNHLNFRGSCGHGALLFAAAAVALAAVALPTVAWADNDASLFGASTLAPGSRAAYVTVGLPDIEVGAGFGLNSAADITPRLRLQYGRGTRLGGFGTAVGAQLRMKIARSNNWTIALVSEPELSLHFYGKDNPPTLSTGLPSLAFSPLAAGIVADRLVLSDVRIIAGIKAPLTFYVTPEWVMNVPLIAELGVEAEVADNLKLVTRFDAGADFYGPGGIAGTQSYFRIRVGLGWSR